MARHINTVTVSGNLTSDPKVLSGGNGKPRSVGTVAVSTEGFQGKEETAFVDFTAFGRLGENVALNHKKGDAVVVSGLLSTYAIDVTVEGKDTKRTMTSIRADVVAADESWATVAVTKNPSSGSYQAGNADSTSDAAPAAAAALAQF
jgi:single-stranded DNA-binding protein